MAIALPLVFLILLLTTTSWFEPVLSCGNHRAYRCEYGRRTHSGHRLCSNAAGSVLQLAVSMDYSIFLLHSFSRFRASGMDVQDAMSHAVKDSFSSVTSSALTTVIGFCMFDPDAFPHRAGYGRCHGEGYRVLAAVRAGLSAMSGGVLYYKRLTKRSIAASCRRSADFLTS